ncbi:exosome complex RNA-binding protein Rrp4 [Nanoarchaeota archaeon]
MVKEKVEKKENDKRRVVIPGEVVASGTGFLPGEGTKREGNDLIATRYGVLEGDDRLVRVVALSGIYLPRKGNIVIARVKDISFNGWMMDINSPYSSFLSIVECRGFISKRDDLSLIYNYGDMVVAGVVGVKSRGVDLTTKERGLHKLEEGLIVNINSHKVPRVIGKQGSMVNLIKDYTKCNVVVGQNGVVWIKGDSIESELLARETINFISDNVLEKGLTNKVQEFLEKKTNKTKK